MASAGRVLLLPKGTWDSATQYAAMDYVYYDGGSYVCKAAVQSTSNPKIDTTHWQIMAQGFDMDAIEQEISGRPDKVPSSAAVDTKANKSDVLTLEEIKASSDVSGKIASASSVKDLNTNLNKLKGTVVWTNPNSSSVFAGQTVNIDLSNYSWVVILYAVYREDNAVMFSPIIPVSYGSTVKIDGMDNPSSGANIYVNRIVTVSATGVLFANGQKKTIGSTTRSDDNNYMIPRQIYAY